MNDEMDSILLDRALLEIKEANMGLGYKYAFVRLSYDIVYKNFQYFKTIASSGFLSNEDICHQQFIRIDLA